MVETAVVAAPENGGDLVVRTRRPGDRVRYRGRQISLKRFLVNRRVGAFRRAGLPLVAAGLAGPVRSGRGGGEPTRDDVRQALARGGTFILMQKPEALFTEEQIRARVQAMGAEIGAAFEGRELAVIGLMKSCLVFMADIIRAIPNDLTCHLLRVDSVREEGKGTSRTEIVYSATIPYEGRDILLLDDIVDTGITLNFLLDHIKEKKPRSPQGLRPHRQAGGAQDRRPPRLDRLRPRQDPAGPLPGGLWPRPRRELPGASLHRDHPPSRTARRRA